MNQKIALFLCILFIVYLFRHDARRDTNVTGAVWVPLLWLLILGSRFVSQWLNLTGPLQPLDAYSEGSPLDRGVFLFLLTAGVLILLKRKVDWRKILNDNKWLLLLCLYNGISFLWSDFPFVSLKRWIKGMGDVVMVLVILSEPSPIEAFKAVMRKCAYVLMPLSILFIKYYPELGRSYSRWTYEPFYHGVTTTKNGLGVLCLILGVFFSWNLLAEWRRIKTDRRDMLIHAAFLLMAFWLLKKADSATSLMCCIIGIGMLIGIRLPLMKRNLHNIGIYFTAIICAALVIQLSFDVKSLLVSSLSRDMTLTGRTDIWNEVINMTTNPFIGSGYESFWLGDRLDRIWSIYTWHPNQAHNGYLEIYINLGLIGISLFAVFLFITFRNIKKDLLKDFDYGSFRITFFIIAVIYNYTEATFNRFDLMWVIFLVISFKSTAILPPRSTRGGNHLKRAVS